MQGHAVTRRRTDPAAVAMHAVALAVWPAAVGWTVFRLLADRYPIRRTS